jgi:hypothetical protein
MDPKLLEILKKAKAVDNRAKQFDKTDTSVLQSNVEARRPTPSITENMGGMTQQQQMMMAQQAQPIKPTPAIDVNSETYQQRVKESKLPPEIQKLMLENPIPQPDAPGTFSMDEEMIKQINPDYGRQMVNETSVSNHEIPTNQTQTKTTQKSVNTQVIRKMIAEEIAKALPSIVEQYFDKKMIQENVKVLSALTKRRKAQ